MFLESKVLYSVFDVRHKIYIATPVVSRLKYFTMLNVQSELITVEK